MRTTSRFLGSSLTAACTILLPVMASAAPIALNFYLEYGTDQSNTALNGYVLFPGLSTTVARTTRTSVASKGSPYFSSDLDAGKTLSGGGSTVFPSFTTYVDAIKESPWTFTVNADTPVPVTYTFDVETAALTNWVTTPVLIGAGQQGAVYPLGSSPTFTWTGVTGFDSARVQLFNAAGNYNAGGPVAPGATSWITAANLLAGNYTFLVSYEKDVLANPPLTVSPPTNGGGAFPDWGGVQLLRTSITDRITFTVVPEPGSALLLLTGAACGALIPRRRRGVF